MKHLKFTFSTKIEFSVPVCGHSFVLRCLPSSDARQKVEASLRTDPHAQLSWQADVFGNALAVGDIVADHNSFSYEVEGAAIIDASVALRELPHPMFSYPGQLTVPSAVMMAFAEGNGCARNAARALSPGELAAGCEALMYAVHDALEYMPGATRVSTSAADAFAQGSGVCQDHAHVMVALLRHWGVPARYVSGLTLGEGATHAWAEANLAGEWRGFDPTRNRICDDTYLAVARGRDWADCPIERGVFLGAADQLQTVFMKVMEQ